LFQIVLNQDVAGGGDYHATNFKFLHFKST
jgi:hypothetical protein